MKTLFLGILLWIIIFPQDPSIVGKWQLVKQTSCIEDEISMDEESEALISDMKTRGKRTSQIIEFKDNNNAEESTKIINQRKSYNSKGMLYKFDGTSLYMLDKRSRTIIETFVVEKFSSDSLILSNSARACETKVFIKIK
ncbi:MAG TPA: hypothetical protein VD884_00420 [Ohtaekwangia sp.]|nr:hypothetical protein [Ohtaekwangia sp.]